MNSTDLKYESELFETLRDNPLLSTLQILKTVISESDAESNFMDKVTKLTLIWHNIAEYFIIQSSINIPEKVFKYMYPRTINFILHKNWIEIGKVTKCHLCMALEKCLNYFITNNSAIQQLNKYLIDLVSNPWDHQSLIKIINNIDISNDDIHNFFRKENLILLETRIKFLIESKYEESALLLTNYVVKFFGIPMINWIELYIRLFTVVINEIEKLKLENDEQNLKLHENKLSQCFLLLADVFQDYSGITRECVLTAFSLNPTEKCYEKLKSFNISNRINILKTNSKILKRKVKDLGAIPPIIGSDMLQSVNYNPFIASSHVLDALKVLKLKDDIISDLISIITYPRYKLLSWIYDWQKLSSDCEKYLIVGTEMRCPIKDLLYLEIDYSQLY